MSFNVQSSAALDAELKRSEAALQAALQGTLPETVAGDPERCRSHS